MSLNIKNERVHLLAREAARRTGSSQTKAVEEALELFIHHLDQIDNSQADLVLELLEDFHRRMSPADCERLSTDGLYDDQGLPA